MQTTLIIIHVIIAILLIAVVLMQHGKQQGLSGAIAGGAETFFGKNKGRTIDAVLKKVTAVVAFLFIVSSIVLAVYSVEQKKAADDAVIPADDTAIVDQVPVDETLVEEEAVDVETAEETIPAE